MEQEGWINKQEVTIAPLNQHMIKVRQCFFVVNLRLHEVALVLSVDFGALCVRNASVMGFRRDKRGRGYEFHGGNNCSRRDYYCQTHAS